MWEKNCQKINTYLEGCKYSESWRMINNLKNPKDILATKKLQEQEVYFKELLIEEREEFKDHQDPNMQNVSVIIVRGPPDRLRLEEVRRIRKALRNGKVTGQGYNPKEGNKQFI